MCRFCVYCKDPNFSDRMWTGYSKYNVVQITIRLFQEQGLVRVYTVYHSGCILLTNFYKETSLRINFSVFTTNVLGFYGKFCEFTCSEHLEEDGIGRDKYMKA